MPPCMPAARRRSRWRRVVANGAAGATPTASSPWSWPSATRSATSGTRRVGRATVGTRPSCRAPTGAATSTTTPRRWPARGAPSSRASDVTELGEQPRPRQQPDGPRLGDVDDHGLTGLARADEGDHAVGAGIAALHGAVVAVDVEDAVAIVAIGTGHDRLLVVDPVDFDHETGRRDDRFGGGNRWGGRYGRPLTLWLQPQVLEKAQPHLADRRVRRHGVPQPFERNLGDHGDRGGVEQLGQSRPHQGHAYDDAAPDVDHQLGPAGVVVGVQAGPRHVADVVGGGAYVETPLARLALVEPDGGDLGDGEDHLGHGR